MVHDRFDLSYWIDQFPIGRLREAAREFVENRRRQSPSEYPTEQEFERHVQLMMPDGEIVTGPAHVAVNEQLRQEAIGSSNPPGAVPTDIFVMALGAPPRRDVTKIGGLPYWPAARDWPRSEDGKPMTFLAQLSFVDSKDISGELPSDILAVFDRQDAWWGLESRDLHFEWVERTDEALVSAVPRADEMPVACYGVIHRTFDLPLSAPRPTAYVPHVDPLWLIQATKIGGMPPLIQPLETVPGRYIATIGSVNPEHGEQHPFVNVKEPIDSYEANHLMWGDVGNVCVFLRSDGSAVGEISCY
jgi:hypothetical protein